jgi:hypothetical protein
MLAVCASGAMQLCRYRRATPHAATTTPSGILAATKIDWDAVYVDPQGEGDHRGTVRSQLLGLLDLD